MDNLNSAAAVSSGMFASSAYSPAAPALHVAGALSNPLFQSVYPFRAIGDWHHTRHLTGLTGRWMDTGATALGGHVAGPWHRLAHGHHLIEDGVSVIMNPKRSFGEFLHHLGLDFLTSTGVPLPFVPSAVSGWLMKSGLPEHLVREFLTINLPKTLTGGLGLVVSGADVIAAFSDSIPHTFSAAGMHALLGTMDLAFAFWPPNPLLLASAAMEYGVAGVTAWRAMVEPVPSALVGHIPVFVPALATSLAVGALGSLIATAFSPNPWPTLQRSVVAVPAASIAGVSATFIAKAAGLSIPLVGPAAALAASLLVHAAFNALEPSRKPGPDLTGFNAPLPSQHVLAPAIPLSTPPIGRVVGDSTLEIFEPDGSGRPRLRLS